MGKPPMLAGCRALDLTTERGFLCGKMLADLGVDVIKVERPGGDAARRMAPYLRDTPGPERSLYWLSYNADKRGITLDIEVEEGRKIFLDLLNDADFVIESFVPGYMESLGLGYAALAKIKPGLVMTSISPFGQSGPYSQYQGPDLVVMGMSGQLFLTGDADRPPVNISLPQACLHAGADAAVGSMIAYRHARKTGIGQHVDISLQQSAAWFLSTAVPYWELSNTILGRVGSRRSGGSSDSIQRQVWPCRDGFVFFFMIGGQQGAKTGRQLVQWMADSGASDFFLSGFDWNTFNMATATQELVDRISDPVAHFFLSKSKAELLEAATTRNISICPLFSMEDILNDANLAAREFWTQVDYPDLESSVPYPRRYVTSSQNSTETRARAPHIGQHNAEVYTGLGLAADDLTALQTKGVI